jgi:hypothetical protein
MDDLSERSDQELLSSAARLIGSQRALTAKLVAHLAEIEERRLHLIAGFSSMFEFCVQSLKMSDGEAFRRILAARLGRRFPVLYSLLASGRVNLSTLELLREWLTDENHEELLAAVAGRSKREVQSILAARFPQPDSPSKIRRQGNIEPLSETRFRIEFTASDELRRKLELCLDLMSHSNPSRDLGVVVERAVDLLLVDLERKRLGRTKRPRRGPRRRAGMPSGVTAAARREVFERDGFQCTYVADDGRRCEAHSFLELDHVHPKGRGGSDDAANLRVRCRAHNQLWAEQVFGHEYVKNSRRLRQQKSTRRSDESSSPMPAQRAGQEAPRAALFEKVRLALRGLGFRDAQARRSIVEVLSMHELSAAAIRGARRPSSSAPESQ